MAGPYLNTGAFKTRITANDAIGPVEELGTWRYEAGKILRYVKAAALIPGGESVQLDHTVTTAALIGNQVQAIQSTTNILLAGIAETTLAANSFGWITCYGPATARVTTNAPAGAALGPSATTATTGVLGIWNMSQFANVAAVAVQTGLSAGSAIFVTTM